MLPDLRLAMDGKVGKTPRAAGVFPHHLSLASLSAKLESLNYSPVPFIDHIVTVVVDCRTTCTFKV